MNEWIGFLNANSGAIQAVSTILLVVITGWYAVRTHQLTSLSRRQINLIENAQKPNVLVTLEPCWVKHSGLVVDAFKISAANCGQQPITVNIPSIKFPNGQSATFTEFLHKEGDFPQRIEPGGGCGVLIEFSDILIVVRKARYTHPVNIEAFYRDLAGNTYLSKPFTFDPNELGQASAQKKIKTV